MPRPVIHETTVSVDAGEALGSGGRVGRRQVDDRPGHHAAAAARARPVRGEILFDGADVLAFDREALRRFLASDAAMIFQDPTTHINPVRTIGDFLTEALVTNNGVTPAEAQETGGRHPARTSASRTRAAGSASTRTSSPAGCCSGS